LKSWPQKLTIERILNGNISKFIEANKAIMPFVKFEPQEHDKVNYATLVSYLSEKPSVKYFKIKKIFSIYIILYIILLLLLLLF